MDIGGGANLKIKSPFTVSSNYELNCKLFLKTWKELG